MGMQQNGQETVVDPVETTETTDSVSEDTQVSDSSNDSTPSAQEDKEPESDDYADPAEYKAAVKDYAKAQAKKEVEAEYERKIKGLYTDLSKNRAAKRANKERLENLEREIAALKQSTVKPDEEPTLEKYHGNVGEWSRAMVEFERKKQQALESERSAKDNAAKAAAAAVHSEWSDKMQTASKTVLPDLPQVIQKIQSEKIGFGIAPDAIEAMMTSPIGIQMYHHLGVHPDEAEDIEDLPKSQHAEAMRSLERKLLSEIYLGQRQVAHATTVAPAVAPVQTSVASATPSANTTRQAPAYKPPTEVKGGAATGTRATKSTEAQSMEEFIRLRNLEEKRRR